MNFSLIPAAFDCLRKGEALANPGVWKTGGEVLKGAIGTFILALNPIGRALGHDPQISPEVAGSVAVVAVYVVGLFFTAATSKTVGILPAKPVASTGQAGNDPAPAPANPESSVPSAPALTDDPATGVPLGG